MKLNRRSFLTSAAAAAGLSLIPNAAFSIDLKKKPSPPPKGRKVLIVGAGISGLYAADLLIQAGFDVQILEASNRYGGKILGDKMSLPNGITTFDVGAQSFSQDMKRVKALGQRFGLGAFHKPPQEPFYLDEKSLQTGAQFKTLKESLSRLEEKAIALGEDLADLDTRKEYAAQSVLDWVKKNAPSELETFFSTRFCSEWCDSPENVSLLHYVEVSNAYNGDIGEMDFRYREGMIGVVEGLAHNLKSKIHLNSPVDHIDYGKKFTVSAKGRKWTADFVVLALPLPHLSRLNVSGLAGFADLQKIASSYRGGGVQKVVIGYDKPFWRGNPCDGDYALPKGMAVMDNSDDAKGHYSIVAFLGGPSSKLKTSEREILEKLSIVLGPQTLKPAGLITHTWLDSQYLPGGYASNRLPGKDNFENLPLQVGRLFVAGSETSSEYPSYVEGALASGERAAKAISAA